MIETLIVIGMVLLAAGGAGFALYRGATGKSRCGGCSGCGDGPCDEGKPFTWRL